MGACCSAVRGCVQRIRLAVRRWFQSAHNDTLGAGWFDPFVKQKLIALFTIFETAVSGGTMLPFILHPELASLGPRIPSLGVFCDSWLFEVFLVAFRAVAGLVGLTGSAKRGVMTMRMYFVFLIINVLTAFLVVVPLFTCECDCDSEKTDPGQCRIVASFASSTNSAPTCKSYDNQSYAEFVNVTYDRYNIAEVGIKWIDHWNKPSKCVFIPDLGADDMDEIRKTLFRLQCRGEEYVADDWSGADWPLAVQLDSCSVSQKCGGVSAHIKYDDLKEKHTFIICQTKVPIVPVLNDADLEDPRCMCYQRCVRSQRRATPEDNEPCLKCPDLAVLFQKNLAFFQEQREKRLWEPGSDHCRAVVRWTAFGVAVLNVLSMPMIIIVWKFIMNHCGDIFRTEDQFGVDRGTAGNWTVDEDSDDDFDFLDASAATRPQQQQAAAERATVGSDTSELPVTPQDSQDSI